MRFVARQKYCADTGSDVKSPRCRPVSREGAVANLRILFLRTFKHERLNHFDALRMIDFCHTFGRLVMIGEASEADALRSIIDEGALDGRRFDDLVEFIVSTDHEWRRVAIDQIIAADVVIVWLRPKEEGFPELSIAPAADSFVEFYRQPLSANRTGAGLLWELAFLHRLGAMEKTVLFMHIDEARRLEQFVRLAEIASAGDVFRPRADGKLESAIPRLSALDKQLAHLRGLGGEASYSAEPDQADVLHMSRSLGGVFSDVLMRKGPASYPADALHHGICDEPRSIFPDYTKKVISRTPVECLLTLPEGELFEVDPEQSDLNCPHCGADGDRMFFYKRGLQATSTDTVRGRCQNCARRSTLVDNELMDF